MRLLFVFVIACLTFGFSNNSTAKSPCQYKKLTQQQSLAYCHGKQFERQVKKIIAQEPQLIRDKGFREFQSWTLRYTKTANRFKVARLVMINPAMGNIKTLLKEYKAIAEMVSGLWITLPENIDLHGSQFSESNDFFNWQQKSLMAVETMFPENYDIDTITFPNYTSHDCEYITPGLNALWFGANALEILDIIGRAKYADQWVKALRPVKLETLYKTPIEYKQGLIDLLESMGTAYDL